MLGKVWHTIFLMKGEVVMRSTVVPVSEEELSHPPIQECQKSFSENVEQTIGNYSKIEAGLLMQKPVDDKDIHHTIFCEDLMVQELDPDDLPVVIPQHDDIKNLDVPCAALMDGKIDPESSMLLSTQNANLAIDTRIYEVELPNRTYNDYAANVLIKNIMASLNDNGKTALLLDDTIGNCFNPECVKESDRWNETPQGAKRRSIITKGYDINVLWKDGTSS